MRSLHPLYGTCYGGSRGMMTLCKFAADWDKGIFFKSRVILRRFFASSVPLNIQVIIGISKNQKSTNKINNQCCLLRKSQRYCHLHNIFSL